MSWSLNYSDVNVSIEAKLSGSVYRAPDGNFHEDDLESVEVHYILINGKEWSETELIAAFGRQGYMALVEVIVSAADEWSEE